MLHLFIQIFETEKNVDTKIFGFRKIKSYLYIFIFHNLLEMVLMVVFKKPNRNEYFLQM